MHPTDLTKQNRSDVGLSFGAIAASGPLLAQPRPKFAELVETFRARARARSSRIRGSRLPAGPLFSSYRFFAIRSYNPANTYALAILHLGDRIRGDGPFVQHFPGGERTPTVAEVQEIQRRLNALGCNTDGEDGRVGRETMLAVRNFQRKVRLAPADGYAGLKVLARLRQGT